MRRHGSPYLISIWRALLTGTFLTSVSVSTPFSSLAVLAVGVDVLGQLVGGLELALGLLLGLDANDGALDGDGQVFTGDAGKIERHGPGLLVLFHLEAPVGVAEERIVDEALEAAVEERNAGEWARVRTTGAKNMVELLGMKRDANGGFCYHPSFTLRGFQP